ncbi:hypothetical protein CYD26_03025 [Pseudomonas sp. FFUP_PS_473]|uniref:DUF4347 domain-containing protein n=1 Tax=Pseudomonas sp. FFUP_PS_473 TaxID=2060418 RepID=UPI000C7E45F5|nr:DUF4347 domain-containing protein [Pseudomonas sp. FFUP_PS_473]PLP95591.1 hypothetical protein CYD26_03025 [Pseudomonas sp. FFUP_PS_473]
MKFIERFSRRSAPQPQAADPAGAPLLMALEPRIMFDASVGVVAQDAAAQTTADAAKDSTSKTTEAASPAASTADTRSTQSERHEVVFIDGQVANVDQLVAGLGSNAEVVILDPSKDGLQQMADYLKGRENLDAIHLLSHGADGTVQLGNVWLASNNLAQHSEALQSIGAALKADGDLLLYGCRVGESAKGQTFLDNLASLTGADVAASADDTGAAALGGNWTLERSSGAIETTALGAQLDGYQSLMAVNFSGGINGMTPTTAAGTLMKYVVGDFNNDGINDILYQNGTAAGSPWVFSAGRSDGTFEAAVAQSSSPFANVTLIDAAGAGYNYYAADFDRDGDIDLLGVSAASGPAYLYRNTSNAFTREPAAGFGGAQYGVRLVVGDFNGDGAADILYQPGSVDASNTWRYARNNGDGTFTDTSLTGTVFNGLVLPAFTTYNYRVVDFDGDGDLDIFAFANNAFGTLLRNNGTSFSSESITSAPTPPFAARALIGDFDGDGDADIFYQNGSAAGSPWLYAENLGNNTFAAAVAQHASPFDAVVMTDFANQNVRVADMDGDGDMDVVGTAAGQNFSVYYQSGGTRAAPVIANLNGDAVNYTEKSSGVILDQGTNAVVTDADSSNFSGGSVRVSVTGGAVSSEDVLSVLSLGTAAGQISVAGSTVLYGGVAIGALTGGTGGNALVITLNANADAAAVTALVRSLQYSNSNTTTPTTTARTVSITVTDETGTTSTAAAVAVNILAVNDAPVVSTTGTNPTFTEEGSAVSLFNGTSINSVEAGQAIIVMTVRVTNLANGASEKLVIDGTDVTLTNGSSFVTLNNGMTVTVSVTSGTATVTMTHAGLSTATAQTIVNNIAYRNDSNAPSGTSRTVTLSNVRDSGGTANGGNNTTSPNVVSVVTLVAVNDAPALSGGPYVIPSTDENTTSAAVSVSTVLAGVTYSDADAGAASGIAITGTVGRGTWEYSSDGTTWTAFGTVSTSSALLLASTSQVRYIPDGANGENVSFTYRAWDGTSGAASTNGSINTGNTTANGGTTAYSTGTAMATLVVTPVNDAPIMTPISPTLSGLTDSSTSNSGDAVSTLVGGIIDPDTGALKGIAVTGTTGTYGTWQYSTDNGTSWSNIGTASDAAALLLRPADRVRFVPDGIHGEIATITYRAWDQTGGTSGFQGSKSNVTGLTGGSNAYSIGTDTASVEVTAVNDAPIVTGSAGSVSWTEGNNVTSTPVTVDNAIVITDPDGTSIASATVSLGSSYILGEDTLAFTNNPATMGNISGTWDAITGVLTLTSAGGATQAQFQAALRAVIYTNDSDTPTTTTRTVSFKVNDGSLDSNVVTRNVTLTTVDDAPVISAPTNVTVTEDSQSPVTGIILSDVDSGSGTLTLTVGAGTLSGTSGSGVTVGGTGSALTLSGTLTAINNFIAAGSLKYTPALNSNTSVTLGLSLDTASVGTDTRNLTLDITPVNDAPTISGPVSINVTEDVAKSMAGITFGDVDAGTGSVRVIFSVANGNGTFTGTASSGVTITNNGTNAITLEGTVADINTMVSNGRLTYLGALNATGVKTMSISINDNGNTGSGGALQVNANISLVIASVNDAPVNNLPGPQSVPQDGSLVFNSANGNLITITDVDVGGNVMTLSLNAAQGQMTLGSIVGLSFSTGDGTNDTSMTFTGTLAAINAALNGLTFTPQAGYNGTGAITIESNDQGYSGSGGVKSDVDTLLITIAPINPKVTGVVATPSSDGANKVGDTIDIVVNFDNAVVVDQTSGSPTLLLDTGVIDRQAVYVGGSGSNQLTFRYIVQAGDVSADLDYASTAALSLNGAVMQSTQGYAAILTLPTVGGADSLGGRSNIVVDGVVPVVGSVSVPVNGTYITGQNLDFTVNFSEAVSVDTTGGTPRIAVTLDTGGTAYADYVSGNGTSALVFRLVVASGQLDSNGITLGSSIDTNGGVITDTAGNATVTTLSGVASTAGVKVDGIAPSVVNVIPPIDGSYKAGDVLSFTVNTSEDVVVDTIGGTPRLVLTVGGVTRYATYVSGAASGELVFQYTVQSGDTAASGISVNGTLDLNGGQVNDTAGNALNLNLGALGNTGNVLVDTTTPYATNITRVDATPTNSGSVSYTVTFSENVRNVDATDFNLIFGGSVAGSIESVTAVDGHTFTVKVSGLTGTGTVRLDLRPGTDIADAAGNLVPGGHVGVSYSIDRDAPSVASVSVPAAGTYVAGAQLDFVVNTDEAVLVDNGNGNPRLAITLDNGRVVYADYLSGSGGNDLVFRLNVTSGMSGNTTFAVAPSIDLNGGSIRDARGNDANAVLNNVGDTRGILVDAKAPRPSSIVVDGPVQPTDRTLNFTLTFDEAVSGVDLNDFSVISTGSASGTLQSVQQIDAKTYRITVGSISGAGTLALSLNALNSGIQDQVGNDLVVSLVGQSQTLQPQTIQPQGAGDLNYRTNPPETLDTPQGPLLQPQLPGFVATEVVSPLAAPGLFDVRTVGGSLQPLGTIFLGNGSSAPSFIAQVFGSSDGGIGGSQGSFGGGEGSVFGSSTFAGIFSRDVPGVSEMNVFNGSQWKQSDLNQGLRGVFGAPTFGQQLNQINEADQRHVRELAMALAQPAQIGKRA